jgi:TPR repeat protein
LRYFQAAAKEHSRAHYMLGVMFDAGKGVKQAFEEAMHCYKMV